MLHLILPLMIEEMRKEEELKPHLIKSKKKIKEGNMWNDIKDCKWQILISLATGFGIMGIYKYLRPLDPDLTVGVIVLCGLIVAFALMAGFAVEDMYE